MNISHEVELLLMLSINELRTAAKYYNVPMGSRSIYAVMCEIEGRKKMVESAKEQWREEREKKCQ